MKSISTLLVLFLVLNLFAQRSEVTLKNGSVILGLIKTENDSTLKIKIKGGSVLHYSKDEIISIEAYDYTDTKGIIYSTINYGYMPGINASKSFHIINGYRFNNHWNLGIGVGKESVGNQDYIPLFLHGQYNLLKANTTPFISVMVGYEMALNNQEQNKGGFTTGAQFGINHYFSDHVGLTTSVGYRYGYFKQENNSGWWGGEPTVTIREINRFEFRFGLVFK